MKPGYEPTTVLGKLTHLSEECAEVIKNIQKTIRMGDHHQVSLRKALLLCNPDLLAHERVTNAALILQEMNDLYLALQAVMDILPYMTRNDTCISGDKYCSYDDGQTFRCAQCKKLVCYCQGVFFLEGDATQNEICNACAQPKKRHAKKTQRSVQSKPARPGQNGKRRASGRKKARRKSL
jgi:hypothetical protein